MRTICILTAFLFLASALRSADLWTGQLFDANCAQHHGELQKYEDCNPTARTATFVLQTSGRMFKLDAGGNKKAAQAWQDYFNSADRAVDPDAKTRALTAVIQGTVSGDQLQVDSIVLR